MVKFFTRFFMTAVLAATVTACATTPQPLEQMGQSRNAVAMADNPETRQYAPIELMSAKEQHDKAEEAFKAEEFAVAKRLAEKAAVLADLAVAKAKANKSRQAVEAVDNNIKTMQKEVNGGI